MKRSVDGAAVAGRGRAAMIDAAPAQEPIKLGVVGPHTGPAASDGPEHLIGAQVAAEEINGAAASSAGARSRSWRPTRAGSRRRRSAPIRKVVTQDKVVAVDCCWFSSSTIAALPTIEELKVPTTNGISFLPDAKETKLTYLFKFAQTPRLESRFVDYWVNKLGVKRVAFLARNDDWGRATSGVYQARLKELGGTVLSADYYAPARRTSIRYLTKIKALNPEGVNVVDVSRACGHPGQADGRARPARRARSARTGPSPTPSSSSPARRRGHPARRAVRHHPRHAAEQGLRGRLPARRNGEEPGPVRPGRLRQQSTCRPRPSSAPARPIPRRSARRSPRATT